MQVPNNPCAAISAKPKRNRRLVSRKSLTLSIALAPAVFTASADAVTYIYTPDNASTFWTSGTQSGNEWTSGGVITAPVSNGSNNSSGAILTFGQTSAGVTSDLDSIVNVNTYNVAGGTFLAQDINLEGSDPSGLAGSVSINGSSGIGGSTIDIVTGNNASNGIFADANGSNISYNFNANLQMSNNTNINGAGTATFIFNGVISGGANFNKNNSGLIILTGNNTFGTYTTTPYHGLLVLAGTCQIGNGGTTGTPGNQGTAGSIGSLTTIGSSGILALDRSDAPTFTNAIFINSSSGHGGTINEFAGTTSTLSGPISSNATGQLYLNNGSTGTINITGTASAGTANTYTTGAEVFGGIVNVSNDQSSATGGWIVGPTSTVAATVNFLSGSTIVGASTAVFRVGNNGASGSLATLLNSAGTVNNAGSLIVGRDAALNISGGTWNQSGAMSLLGEGGYSEYANILTGGTFNYTGTSPITLQASASGSPYISGLNVAGGTFTTGAAFNEVPEGNTVASGTLILASGGTLTLTTNIASLITQSVGGGGSIATPMELGNGSGGIINTAGFNTSIAVVISNLTGQAGALTLTGGGTLTLSADNTYTGQTNISSGILTAGISSISAGGPFGQNSAITLANSAGASLVLTGFNASVGSLTGGGSSGGNVNLGSGTLTVGGDNTSPAAYAGSIFGTGGFTKIGTGTAILSGSNGYSGPTTITAGTVAFAQRVALYGGTTSSFTATNIVVATGATLDVNVGGTGEFTSADLDTLLALGTPTGGFQSGSTISLDTSNAATGFTYNTSITNPGGNTLNLTKIGANTLTLNGANSYTGLTTVTNGTLVLNGNDTAATGGFNILPSTVTATTATLNLGAGALFNIASPATVSIGNLTASGLSNNATINTGVGTIVNNTGSLLIQRAGYLNVSTASTWNQSGALMLFPGSSTGYGSYLNVNGTFNYTGTSAIAINPSTTRSGVAVITIGGTFNTSAGFTDAGSSNTGTGTLALSGGTLALNSSTGLGTIAAAPLLVTLTGSSTIDTTNSPGTNTIASPITGTGSLTKAGANTLTLTGTSTYSGSTTITGGVLLSGATNALSPNSAVNIAGGTLNASGFANTISSLTVTSGALDLGPGNVLAVTGAATLGSTLNLIGFSYTSTPETLMTYNSESGTFNTATGIPSGDMLGYNSSALVLEVAVATGPLTLTWNDTGGSPADGTTWDIGHYQNWNSGSAASVYTDGAIVTFNDAKGSNSYTVALNTVVHPTSVTVATAGAYNISGTGGIANVTAGTTPVTLTGTGSLTLGGSNTYTGGTTVGTGSDSPTLILLGQTAFPVATPLTVNSGATVQIAAHSGNSSNVAVTTVSTLSNSGKIDITNNDLIVRGSLSLTSVRMQVVAGLAGGSGITSSNVSGNPLTTIGVIQALSAGTLDGATVNTGDIEAKYTYYGDTNLDGAVDGSDYTNIDNGFSNHLTGWQNGDFNYDGVVDGSDYTLIDNTFNTQGPTLGTNPLALIASNTAQIGGSAVPEPATLGLLSLGVIGLLGRRHRRANGK